MKKLILLIVVILVAGKYLFFTDWSVNLTGGILGILGGPVLILLIIIWLLKPKKHKTGYDDIDELL